MKGRVLVSDHALMRYLERILEIDLEEMRRKIAMGVREAARAGAQTYTSAGATFVLQKTATGDICVVTVLTDKMRRDTHRRRNRRMKAVASSVQS